MNFAHTHTHTHTHFGTSNLHLTWFAHSTLNGPSIELRNKRLKDEVGMAGSNSTQTRFVRIITSTIHPYAWDV